MYKNVLFCVIPRLKENTISVQTLKSFVNRVHRTQVETNSLI